MPDDLTTAKTTTEMVDALVHGRRVLRVRVEMLNDDGQRRVMFARGETVDEAVAQAEALAYSATGDDSWTMNDWQGA